MKTCLASPPVLIYPDWNKPFYIEGDSSDYAVRSVLSQKDDNTKILRPIGYSSYSLKPEQRRYGPGERECFSLLAASRRWRPYCRAAKELNFITDHEPLVWLRDRKDPFGKYARWIIEFEGLNYKIQARNGLDHVVPDCLSRIENPVQDDVVHQDEVFLDNAIFQFRLKLTRLKMNRRMTQPFLWQ